MKPAGPIPDDLPDPLPALEDGMVDLDALTLDQEARLNAAVFGMPVDLGRQAAVMRRDGREAADDLVQVEEVPDLGGGQ